MKMGCGKSKVVPFSPVNSKNNVLKPVISENAELKLSKHDETYPGFLDSNNGNDIVPQDIEYLPEYTVKDISKFNSELGYIQIFPYRNFVCCTSKFKKLIVKTVKEFERYKQEMYNDVNIEKINFHENFVINPAFYIWSTGLRMDIIKTFLVQSKVAKLRHLDYREKWADEKADVDLIYNDLEHSKLSQYEREYMDILIRYKKKYDELQGVPRKLKQVKHDINKDPFPLPSDTENQREHLRGWLESWELFDTEIPIGGAWSMLEMNVMLTEGEEIKDDVSDLELPEFEFDIWGEAAWDVIEMDIVKKDITTDSQNKIWELRSKRTDFNDPERMRRKRQKLERYFVSKYKLFDSEIDQFKEFANILLSHWEEFQKLCKND